MLTTNHPYILNKTHQQKTSSDMASAFSLACEAKTHNAWKPWQVAHLAKLLGARWWLVTMASGYSNRHG